MAEQLAFVTEEEINLLVDIAVPENTKNPLYMPVTFLTVICNLTQYSNTKARNEIFAWFQPSFTLSSSPSIKNLTETNMVKDEQFLSSLILGYL